MQCPSCRFENMPGLDSCGRCGTSLSLGTAVIDINPPRASKTAKRVRKVVPRRLIYQARDIAGQTQQAVAGSIVNDSHIPLPEPAVLTRLIVPGWAHIHSGLVFRGRAFLGAYIPLLLLGLVFWGTYTGSILLGLAFSVHASSVLDILIRQGTVRFPRMMATAALTAVILAALFYYPAGLLLMRIANPIVFEGDTDLFKRFDVVLVNRWAFAWRAPTRGTVVLFAPARSHLQATGYQLAHVRFALAENELIDRVIGLPGDKVVWDKGTLTVNGTAVSWRPLLAERLPPHLEITVPEARYLILPTSSVAAPFNTGSLSFWTEGGLVPEADILGGAYLRSNPLSRLWFIR